MGEHESLDGRRPRPRAVQVEFLQMHDARSVILAHGHQEIVGQAEEQHEGVERQRDEEAAVQTVQETSSALNSWDGDAGSLGLHSLTAPRNASSARGGEVRGCGGWRSGGRWRSDNFGVWVRCTVDRHTDSGQQLR